MTSPPVSNVDISESLAVFTRYCLLWWKLIPPLTRSCNAALRAARCRQTGILPKKVLMQQSCDTQAGIVCEKRSRREKADFKSRCLFGESYSVCLVPFKPIPFAEWSKEFLVQRTSWSKELGLFVWCNALGVPETNKKLEKDILKDYNPKHRPVKKEQTSVQVAVYISVTHVEKVDEREQTMLVHGHLWATWVDEYLTWDPASYNGSEKLSIEAWRIWQPALALYNSARGNAWHLYMNGMPALISSNGKVWASGAFSFHVTCRFDFSSWPYDEQECPIVISDWVYDLSRVNLSDPNDMPWNKPTIRLNYDPVNGKDKKHVAGWEVSDTWRRHCYWGPNGCREEQPEGQPEWYWSLLEFGVKLKRHAPYVAVTILLPSVVTVLLTLVSFWVDTWSTSCSLLIFNILLQGLFGWDLIRELPPGSGGVPRIVTLYGLNLILTTSAFGLHVVLNYLQEILPNDMKLPRGVSSFPAKLRLTALFETKGLSFDPQTLLNTDNQTDEVNQYHSPLASIHSSSALEEEQQQHDTANLIPLENEPESSPEVEPTPDNGMLISLDNIEDGVPNPTTSSEELEGTAKQLFFIRRLVFCIYVIIYVILLPYGLW